MKKESTSQKSSRGIGWVIEQMGKQKAQSNYLVRSTNYHTKKEAPIRVCVVCGISWQHVVKPPYVEYYKDFTTYKLDRGVCPRCCSKS